MTIVSTTQPHATARAARQSLYAVLSIVGFFALTALAAQIKVLVPWSPVPATLQPLAVLLAGLSLPPSAGVAAMLLYLVCGASGLPVFSPDSLGLLGPTGGYLVGFVAAAWTIAVLRSRTGSSVAGMSIAALGGTLVLFLCGALGLFFWAWLGGFDPISAVRHGSLPFVPKAFVEVGVAVSFITTIRGVHRYRVLKQQR